MSWVDIPGDSDFPLANLPYGIFTRHAAERPRGGVAVGEYVLDIAGLHAAGIEIPSGEDFGKPYLNEFMSRGAAAWSATRARLTELLTDPAERPSVEKHLVPLADVTMRLPFQVGDYVDFYSSRHHAENVGRIFRPDGEPLTPNWLHLPIGYHGRAGTVVVSGTPVIRPCGQRRPAGAAAPTFGPSARLDIEAEVGFVVGVGSPLGAPVPPAAFAEHVFGVILVNDWSARDIQAWEYVPLGPFLGKSFATSVSPWVVPLAALENAWTAGPNQHPDVLPYLATGQPRGLDLSLGIEWNGTEVCRPPFASMYWSPAQQLAHMTINGASLRTGDLFASGTVSGPERDQRGSFLELSWNGTEPVTLEDGSQRSYLEDGDTVTIRATAPGQGGVRIGFGAVTGTIRPPVR